MSNILFTSDTHFFHKNVIQYSNRPFSSVEEMHDLFIARWNSVVTPKDLVYHLGDFILSNRIEHIEEILSRLNGKIFLVEGNHDVSFVKKLKQNKIKKHLADKIVGIEPYITKKFNYRKESYYTVMMHYPIEIWDRKHYDSLCLHGHCHDRNPTMNDNLLRYNVGVDLNEYTPITFTQIIDKKHNLFKISPLTT